jgi:syntaxin 8/SYP5 family syntaxin
MLQDDLEDHVDVTNSRLQVGILLLFDIIYFSLHGHDIQGALFIQRVQKKLAVLNKRTKGGCSCMALLLSVVAIVLLAVIVWLLIKYL